MFKYSKDFLQDLIHAINKNGIDNELNTPDYILAEAMFETMQSFGLAIQARDKHMNLTKGE